MKSILWLTGSTLALGGTYLLLQTMQANCDEDKEKLLEILRQIRAEYIPIYVHSYNLYTSSINELKGKKNSEDFIRKEIEKQSKCLIPSYYF